MNESLCRAATEAAERAYAPYSAYPVGAAVLTESGDVFTGANIENRSYGLSVCAERVAIFKAVSEGEGEIQALAVHTRDGAAPCGACRQVLLEFGSASTPVYIVGNGSVEERTLDQLLPEAFTTKP